MMSFFFALRDKNPWIQLVFFLLIVLFSGLLLLLLSQLLSLIIFGQETYMATLQFVIDPKEWLKTNDFSIQTMPKEIISTLALQQIISHVGMFILPVFLFLFLIYEKGSRWQYLNKRTTLFIPTILMVFALIFFILPWINLLGEFNNSIQLPEWMNDKEEASALIIEAFFRETSIGWLFINLFMIAVIPALGEELLFRGVLQNLLVKITRNVHIGIFIAAIIFSAFHFQFYGFLPRLMLGILFGYLYYWSKNIWIPIIAHFINNGAAVVVAFFASKGVLDTGYEDFGKTNDHYTIILSLVFTVILLWFIRSKENQRNEHQIF
jgi:membrane protease YdiL (CAAX protease family)